MAFESGTNEISDLTSLIDLESKTVRSNTDELFWDYGNGTSMLNSPRAQGATGDFQAAGIINTDALTVVSTNSYASLLAVSMDGMILTTSNKILLQIGTTARPHGWRTENIGNDKHRITNLGSSPWNIEALQYSWMLTGYDFLKFLCSKQILESKLKSRKTPCISSYSSEGKQPKPRSQTPIQPRSNWPEKLHHQLRFV